MGQRSPNTEVRRRFREIARELAALAAMPNVRVFASEAEASRAELRRLGVKTPSGSALRICWPPRRRRTGN